MFLKLTKNRILSRMWPCIPKMPALRKVRSDDYENILSCTGSLGIKKQQNNNKTAQDLKEMCIHPYSW